MKHSATFSDLATGPQARAVRPLPEPALTYFPDVRSALSGRDLTAGAASIPQSAAMVDEPHIPVLLDRCVELLAPALTRTSEDGTGATLVDATLGAGGHSERFLTQFPGLRVIGLDRDPDALRIAGDRLAPFGDRVALVRTRYDGISEAVAAHGGSVDAILFDLGVSSMQLDRAERGFSYSADAPLDMRMDSGSDLTAAQILNSYDEKALARVLREYGEEKFAGRIASYIVRRRATSRSVTTVCTPGAASSAATVRVTASLSSRASTSTARARSGWARRRTGRSRTSHDRCARPTLTIVTRSRVAAKGAAKSRRSSTAKTTCSTSTCQRKTP